MYLVEFLIFNSSDVASNHTTASDAIEKFGQFNFSYASPSCLEKSTTLFAMRNLLC